MENAWELPERAQDHDASARCLAPVRVDPVVRGAVADAMVRGGRMLHEGVPAARGVGRLEVGVDELTAEAAETDPTIAGQAPRTARRRECGGAPGTRAPAPARRRRR